MPNRDESLHNNVIYIAWRLPSLSPLPRQADSAEPCRLPRPPFPNILGIPGTGAVNRSVARLAGLRFPLKKLRPRSL